MKKAKVNSNNIYKLPNGSYRVVIRKTKKIKKEYNKTFPTLDEAIKKRDKFLARYTLGLEEESDILFKDFCKIFLDTYKRMKKADGTIKSYSITINHDLIPAFGNRVMKEISTLDIQEFIIEQSNRMIDNNNDPKVVSGGTVKHIYTNMKSIFNKAVTWGYINKSPVKGIELPKYKPAEQLVFDYEQLPEIIEIINKEPIVRNRCMFIIGLCCGLREEEVSGLHLDDIDFIKGTLSVERAVTQDFETAEYKEKETKSEAGERVLPIPKQCMDIIKLYLKDREKRISIIKILNPDYEETPNLFFNKDGDYMRPKYIGKLWRQFREKNNLPNVKYHGLRHTYCTTQANNNPDLSISDVQYLMGHSSQSTTFHYMHKQNSNIKNATKVFNNLTDDGTIEIKIESIASIISGRNLVDIKEVVNDIEKILKRKINLFDMANELNECREILYRFNPSFKEMISDSERFKDDVLFVDIIKRVYGNTFIIENIEKEHQIQI